MLAVFWRPTRISVPPNRFRTYLHCQNVGPFVRCSILSPIPPLWKALRNEYKWGPCRPLVDGVVRLADFNQLPYFGAISLKPIAFRIALT